MGMFDTAKAIPQPPKAKAAAAKEEVEVAGVEQLAMIDALQKALEGIRAGIESGVKAEGLRRFELHVREHGTRPQSIKAIERGASASIELRRKGSNIALNDQQVTLLTEYGIQPKKDVTTPALFALNPSYCEDSALLEKVEAALAGIVPPDFIVRQEERSRYTVDEALLEQVAKLLHNKRDVPVDVLTAVTVLACKPKLVTTNIVAILDFVRGLIVEPLFGAAADEAKVVRIDGRAA